MRVKSKLLQFMFGVRIGSLVKKLEKLCRPTAEAGLTGWDPCFCVPDGPQKFLCKLKNYLS